MKKVFDYKVTYWVGFALALVALQVLLYFT